MLGATTSICPRCRRLLDAELIERDGRVLLARTCPEHGRIEAVVYGDAERYREIHRFDKPGEEPLVRQTEESRGCSHDCGICPEWGRMLATLRRTLTGLRILGARHNDAMTTIRPVEGPNLSPENARFLGAHFFSGTRSH